MKFREFVRLLEQDEFTIVKEKGLIHSRKTWVRHVDSRDLSWRAKEDVRGTCHAIPKAAGIKK